LRSVPESLLRELYNKGTASYSSIYYNTFASCFNLDEIRGMPTRTSYTSAITSNLFGSTFNECYRLKEMIFDTDNGTPRQINWSNQTINLSGSIGYSDRASEHTGNGISADKQVTDDVSYQALKNDPDWFTVYVAYSRYNHDSAVNTINSLPDVTVGSGNTIKFRGEAGSKTDGGAINTLTEEEIAVAAVKGWTVTFV
jgi:hypothetical protein